ncbi:MAG TPA: GAF domain-containing sensor histidine kinase [Solirubrobacteraceae bacterium]|nr:GAF domain-containing sensor histidine kinase [Solirubrobacteraceae bacterium]
MSDNDDKLRRLLDVGRALVGELDPEAVLERVLEEARELTGARYAALGVLDEARSELERFLTVGIDEASHRAIGDLPRGRGVLGVLIDDPRPLRLVDVGDHPRSYGFPAAHPEMHGFLGVPILIRGEAWGNLYLTEKTDGGEFTQEDEDAVVVLAQWAATAIGNARLYEHSEQRRRQLERAVRSLEAARDIADAITGASDLDRILELIVKRGRALVDARTVLVMLREGEDLVVAASAGHARGAEGHRIPIVGSTSGEVLRRGRPERLVDAGHRLRVAPVELGVRDAHTALIVPVLHRGNGLGVLAAFDRGPDADPFTEEDEQLMRTFAASAANAVALSRSVETDRLRSTIAAADEERKRWARELHDQTLQSLGGLRVSLASILGRGDLAAKDARIRQAIEDIEFEIANLRGIISDLRPSLLDDLGLVPAIDAMVNRRREAGLEIASEIALADPVSGQVKLDPDLETTVYRILQEALTNVARHARAEHARVAVTLSDGRLLIEVEDDGSGFDADAPSSGFGLAGMRERVYLADGTLEIEPSHPGTLVRVRLPVRTSSEASALSAANQVAT